MKVAILGASGIGRNHARWFEKHGCHVAAILGSSTESVAQTTEKLRAESGFDAQGYTDLGELLREEQPDAVCIASPPTLHFAQALDCLEAGVHVLCEKPLVYAPGRPFRENRDGARQLVKVANQKKLVLATQLQYAGAAPILCKLTDLAPADVADFAMEMESSNPNSPRNPRDLWVDLGPHPLSVAQALAGTGATLNEESVQFLANETEDLTELTVRLGVNCADGRYISVRAILRAFDKSVHNRAPRRRFAFNGRVVSYEGARDSRGIYHAEFITNDGYTTRYDDPVDYLIGRFVRACRGVEPVEIDGNFGVQNLEWLLKIADHAPASTRPTAVVEPSVAEPSTETESFVDEAVAPNVAVPIAITVAAAAPLLNADSLDVAPVVGESSETENVDFADSLDVSPQTVVDETPADDSLDFFAPESFVDEAVSPVIDEAAFVDEANLELQDDFGFDETPAQDANSNDGLALDFFDKAPVPPESEEPSLDLPISPSDGKPIIDNFTPVPDLNFLDDFGFDPTPNESTKTETEKPEDKPAPVADPFASFNLLD